MWKYWINAFRNSTEPHLHFQLQNGRSFYYSAGLPIRFSKVNLSIPSNYKNIDPRPNMDISRVPEGLITRGYNVSNKEMPFELTI